MNSSLPYARRAVLILAAMLGGVTLLKGQATSDPVTSYRLGAYDASGNYLGLLSNSDTMVAIPFARPAEYVGTIASVASNVVTVAGSPGWTVNQFVYAAGEQPKTYYALIGPATGATNPREGCIYTVTANTAGTLTLNLNGDSISSIPAGSTITLIPYWTLATVFPASGAGVSFTPTTSTFSMKTQILIPDTIDSGTNLAAIASYFYISSGTNIGWRAFGDLTTDHSNDILAPGSYFIVRQSNNAPTGTLTLAGTVALDTLTVPLRTQTSGKQDNPVTNQRPVDVTLANSGLSPAAGNFAATSSTFSMQDQLLFFDNSVVGFNKSSSKSYYYISNGTNVGWRLFGDSVTTDHGNDVIPSGSALIIRKAAAAGTTQLWQNTSPYEN